MTRALAVGTRFLRAPAMITLADWICACGIGWSLPEGASVTTIERRSTFFGSVHCGRTTQAGDVEVADAAPRRVIALFRCAQLVLAPRS